MLSKMPLTIVSIIIRYLEYPIYSGVDSVINVFKETDAKIGAVTVNMEHIKKEPGRKE